MSNLTEKLESPEINHLVISALTKCTPDSILPYYLRILGGESYQTYRHIPGTPLVIELLSDEAPRWTILHALAVLSKQSNAYLEVGTRRGWSLCCALAGNPELAALCVDLWIQDYGCNPNPGPHFVAGEAAKIVANNKARFISGNSHVILPTLDKKIKYDLILVDGDHTFDGAVKDINDCWPLLSKGGYLIFDDLNGFDYAGHDIVGILTSLGGKVVAKTKFGTGTVIIEK